MSKSKFVTVETEYGPVKGVQKSSDLGRNYIDFNVVPYMRAPIGKLRFRDAQTPEKWTKPLDTTGNRPSYFTVNFMTKTCEGQEDAGVLSISTPYLDRKLPVAVYIHGGGFQMGCDFSIQIRLEVFIETFLTRYGTMEMFGPDYLLQKDIILVKINYRVGPIGFLSLEDPELGVPGNAGLKDQVFALKWIQKNIANFGGDPNNVTVFGTSVS